jgi:hypothetical protein
MRSRDLTVADVSSVYVDAKRDCSWWSDDPDHIASVLALLQRVDAPIEEYRFGGRAVRMAEYVVDGTVYCAVLR